MKNMNDNYTILHCHTMLSNGVTNIDSVTKYADYIDKAKECGMKAMAISEHGSVFSWINKKKYMESNNIKYIHAEEFYVTETLDEKIRDNYHCLLIAKNYDGVLELNKLSSKAFNRNDNSYYYVPRISYEDLKNTSDNIIITTACLGGILSKGRRDLKNDFFRFILKNKHRCFFELQHHISKDQIEYNKTLYNIAKKYGIDLVMCTDTHALNEKHVKAREILQKSKNIHFDGEDEFDLTFKTYDELVECCKKQNAIPMEDYLIAIENTNKIADMVETFELDYTYKYPHLWGDNSEKIFKEKILEGLKRRGIDKYPNYNEYIERIKYELKAYEHNQAIDFMLLMEDIINWCNEKDIKVGYGRGSCNGSVIAYLLGITEMDSIKHGLNFDRFMNIERVSLSDIDTDFPPSRINEVKEYIFNKHGLYCSDIVTFNTIALKGAIRDVGRALEIPLSIVGEICDSVENKEKELREEHKELFKYVDMVNGCIVSVGNHPCFLRGELVNTPNGYVEIQNIKKGDMVLTHNNLYKEVVDVINNKSDDIYTISPSSSLPINTTGNHPFYVRKRKNKRLRKHKDGIDTTVRVYEKPQWIKVENIRKGDMVGYPINNKSVIPKYKNLNLENKDLWWVIGRYVGDGWINSPKRNKKEEYLIICCDKSETTEITDVLDKIKYNYRISEEKTVNKIYINNKELLDYLKIFGKYAHGKFIPNEVLDLPNFLLESFLNGYISADGNYLEKTDRYSFKTVSKKLALGLINCVAKVYHRHCIISVIKKRDEYIQGRLVHSKEKYSVSFTKNKRKKERSFYENGYIWCPCKKIEKQYTGEQDTYNLCVLDDNSYTINNIAVHNCGMIVAPHSIDDRLGTFTTSTDNVVISQINMKEVDSLNYVKLDLLKLDTIELINETCKLANIDRLTPDNIDVTDVSVWNAMRDDTTQIFQWEGDTGNEYIKKLLSDDNIKKFQEVDKNVDRMTLLSIGNSAIRPAGASYRDDLANGVVRKSGSQAIDDFLKPTFGYLVFQCQIIEFLHEYCGFTMGEADIVRRHFAKKYGTENDIPIIKYGGYMNDKKDHYIDGFIVTMQKKYDMSEEEAENTIVSFLQVIEDASRYLFSLNHSQPYSYEGYVSGWLRYYYPLEFLTTALNINKNKEEKTFGLTKYCKKVGIEIKSPKFRKSKSEYQCDKSENCIYKGIDSIKFMNSQIADELYELKDNDYDCFIDLLEDISKLSINSKQLDILIKIGFFSEFGTVKNLLTQNSIYNSYHKCKQIKKEKINDEIINIIKNNSEIETEKMFKNINNINLMKELCSYYNDESEEPDTLNVMSYQIQLLGYTNIIDTTCNDDIYIVEQQENNNYGTPFVSLYHICDGESKQSIKINKKWYSEYPCKVGDVLRCAFKEKNKRRKVDNKWVEIEEKETILDIYSII